MVWPMERPYQMIEIQKMVSQCSRLIKVKNLIRAHKMEANSLWLNRSNSQNEVLLRQWWGLVDSMGLPQDEGPNTIQLLTRKAKITYSICIWLRRRDTVLTGLSLMNHRLIITAPIAIKKTPSLKISPKLLRLKFPSKAATWG